MEKIELKQVRLLLAASAIHSVQVKAEGNGFAIIFNHGQMVLSTFRREVRIFSRIQTVLEFIHQLGIGKFEVDVSRWSPDQKTLRANKEL